MIQASAALVDPARQPHGPKGRLNGAGLSKTPLLLHFTPAMLMLVAESPAPALRSFLTPCIKPKLSEKADLTSQRTREQMVNLDFATSIDVGLGPTSPGSAGPEPAFDDG